MSKKDIALIYDFDGTLAEGNIQEYNFIPALNMKSEEFWKEVEELKVKNNMESVLAYMYLMLKKADLKNISVKKSAFLDYGKNIDFFDGVEEWFDRINEYGQALGVNIHHYVISSGIKEMIEGTKISDKFDRIYACSFLYNIDDIAKWPAVAVNYTNKTQFLFRINKGIFEVYDESINDVMSEDEKQIAFSNMIYLGDGLTDVPCMKIVKDNDGTSIAVYDDKKEKTIAENLLKQNRVNFISPTNYTENSILDRYIKETIKKISGSVKGK